MPEFQAAKRKPDVGPGSRVNVISIGEVLWDIVGQEEHLGGATFNFSAHLSRLGHPGFIRQCGWRRRLGQKLSIACPGLACRPNICTLEKDHPTGTVSVVLAADGQPKYVLHRPAAYDFPRLTALQFDGIVFSSGGLDLLRNAASDPFPDPAVDREPAHRASSARRFYDVNLRADRYSPELIKSSCRGQPS